MTNLESISNAVLFTCDENEIVKSNQVVLKTFFNIMNKWNVSLTEQRTLLGNPTESIFFGWKEGKDIVVKEDVLIRISFILGIYKVLATIFQHEVQANRWISASNAAFDNKSALQYMIEVKNNIGRMQSVRRYLGAQ